MRPGKAVVIVYQSEEFCEAHNEIISKGICGRLVLRTTLQDSVQSQSADFWSDSLSPSPADPFEAISSSNSKIIYLFLSTPVHISGLLSLCEQNHYFLSLILHKTYPIPPPLSPLTPKQSYMFENCEELQTLPISSVFYVDYEKNYTRIDWLQSINSRQEVGANHLILFENHHKELRSRLGLNSKYGS
jgi:hypothetical protein